MKKIFSQLGHWMFKNKKRLVYGILALIVGQICFFGIGEIGLGNDVFADGNASSQSVDFKEKAKGWFNSISFIQKYVYVLLYPILLVAGKLVDNSLVYGEVFNFDIVLWQLWNTVRNLANFGLGFIFIYKIFSFLIKGQKGNDIKNLIIRSLIAGVGIQASRFLMAALIDVSTIVAYGVGGLPISTLGKDSETGNQYVLETVVSIDTENPDEVKYYLSNAYAKDSENKDAEVIYISECELFTFMDDNDTRESLLLAPKYSYYHDGNKGEYHETEKLKCYYDDHVYYFLNHVRDKDNKLVEWNAKGTDAKAWQEAQNEYVSSISAWKGDNHSKSEISGYIGEHSILQIGNAQKTEKGKDEVVGIKGSIFTSKNTKNTEGEYEHWGLDVDNKWTGEEGKVKGDENKKSKYGLIKMQDLLNSESFVGVFTSLYSSLLNAGFNMKLAEESGTYVNVLNGLLSLGHLIAIGIPLIVMVVVLIMRLGVLRMGIALSPMIVLLKAFDLDKKLEKTVLKYISLENLIPIIFAPAFICFAVSISAVLVRLVMNMNWEDQNILSEDNTLGGLVRILIGGVGPNVGKLVCSVICIAITRFLARAAIEASMLGKTGIVQGLKKLATSALGSVPVVPVPGFDENGKLTAKFVGASSAGKALPLAATTIKDSFTNKDTETVQDLINPERVSNRRADMYKQTLLSDSTIISNNWTEQEIEIKSEDGKSVRRMKFGDLSGEKQKEVIAAINGLSDDTKRAKFGVLTNVKAGGKNYVFKTDSKIYEEQ